MKIISIISMLILILSSCGVKEEQQTASLDREDTAITIPQDSLETNF